MTQQLFFVGNYYKTSEDTCNPNIEIEFSFDVDGIYTDLTGALKACLHKACFICPLELDVDFYSMVGCYIINFLKNPHDETNLCWFPGHQKEAPDFYKKFLKVLPPWQLLVSYQD